LGCVDFYDDVGHGIAEICGAFAPFLEDSRERTVGWVVSEEVFCCEFGSLDVYDVIQVVFWLVEHPDESPELGWGWVNADDGDNWGA
jgi:hypothetical protein